MIELTSKVKVKMSQNGVCDFCNFKVDPQNQGVSGDYADNACEECTPVICINCIRSLAAQLPEKQ